MYTPKLLAYLEPAEVSGQIRVTIDRREVEGVLLANDDPVPGSFSDFVWIFDAESGDVVSASLKGTLVKELDWGLFRSKARTRIDLAMASQRVGGVEKPRRWLGQQLFGYCDDPSRESCEIVSGQSYDSASGYVYAVGALRVHFGELTLQTFSPLGEAVFAESEAADVRHLLASDGEARSAAEGAARRSLAATRPGPQAVLPVVSSGPPSR